MRRILIFLVCAGVGACTPGASQADDKRASLPEPQKGERLATFAGGCFWCMEPPFEALAGVRAVTSGYTGGQEKRPTYKQVSRGKTGHTEAVQIVFDPQTIPYDELLQVYWRSIDPTDRGGQFADRGSQYRPEIFYHSDGQRKAAARSKKALAKSGRFDEPIVVPITRYAKFYAAEQYHQDYYKKNPKHYKAYRKGSGREGFLRRVWGKAGPVDGKRYHKPSQTELRRRLTAVQYRITQQDGTEPPFRNAYWNEKRAGIYVDVVSGEPLFSSKDKFKSGTGWPSFTKPLVPGHVVEKKERSLGMERTEVRSKHGDSHLGHVFDDGPKPTGLRYCINSAALRFIPASQLKKEGYGEFAGMF